MQDNSSPGPAVVPEVAQAPRWRDLLRSRGVLAVLLGELLVAALVADGLWMLRREMLDSELRRLASLSAVMAVQADGMLGVADVVLRATRTELHDGFIRPGEPASRDVLRKRVQALPMFRALVVTDAEGRRLLSSREVLPGPPDAAAPIVIERDYFVAARQAREPKLFVGVPFISRADGKVSIGVTMDWHDANDRFGGVVALVADPEFLDGGFQNFSPAADATMEIYRSDRQPIASGVGGSRPAVLPIDVVDALWHDAAMQPRMVVLPDGTRRLVGAHRLQRFALLVVVTRDAHAVLQDWEDQAWLVGAFAACAMLMTFVLTLRNQREQALRRASQASLAAEQERAMRAFQAAQVGHWEWCPHTRVSHLSPRMRELLGLAATEPALCSGGLLELGHIHPDDVAPLRSAFEAHQQGRSPALDVVFRVRQADGHWRHVRSRGHAWRDAAGDVTLLSGTATDVSAEIQAAQHRQALEEQLQRARKLEALGTLAGGVAHDFNNILAAILGYGELARAAVPDGSALARQLDHILQGGLRGKALVQRILSFSRNAPQARTTFLLEPVIDEVLTLLQASLPQQVRLDRQLHAPRASIVGDPTMVHEAAMNLCTNAMQALAQGGTLGVELVEIELPAVRVLFDRSLPAGRYVRLSVRDDGSGIPAEVMSRLFEPFFTTKGPLQGTGLGLAVVRGVMADLGGGIDVQSVPGQGACFTLYFPWIEAPPVRPEACEPVEAALPQGQGQAVLVVDDEPPLVELAEELLAGLGYEPIGFTSSAQALAALRLEPGRFDLVLTDEVMPGMTGTALAAAIHAVHPALPIVLASGYGGPQLELRAAAVGVVVAVRKPLARAELARAMAEALHRPGPPAG